MAVDYFLIEGPRAVPQEFAAWEAARKEHADYFFQNCGPDPEPPPDFDERGQALARKAAALEETARAAFLLWLMRPKGAAAVREAQECKACHGKGYTNEGDPEIGNALFDCEACGGSGCVPAGAVPTLPAVAVAAAVPQPQVPGELPRHQFWGAGEPDCPPELKAPNGELHTTRCKVCGDGWRKSHNVCLAAREPMPVERIAMLWNSLPLETDPQSVVAFVRAVERFHGIGTSGVRVPAAPDVVDGLMALVYLYGAHCAEHPEDVEGARERLRAVKEFAFGVQGTPAPSKGEPQP